MTLHGVDVSSYQPDWSPTGDDDFVFIKGTEGTSYTNPYGPGQASRARAKGLQVGWYAFIHHGNIQAQADYFVQQIPSQAADLLVCDWEYAGCTTADKDQFIRAVKAARPGHKVGLYCNTNWWLNVDTSGYCGDFLWIAAYQSSPPNLKQAYKFWQYSDHPIDQNHGYFASLAELKSWAGEQPDPAPIPDPKPVPVPKDDLDMSEHFKFHTAKNQPIKKADTYQPLWLNDDHDEVSIAMKPAKIVGTVYLEVSGLGDGDSFYLHPFSCDVKKQAGGNKITPVTVNNDDRIPGPKSGWIHQSIPFVWDLGDQAKGYDYRALRFQVKSNTTKAVIENARIEGFIAYK